MSNRNVKQKQLLNRPNKDRATNNLLKTRCEYPVNCRLTFQHTITFNNLLVSPNKAVWTLRTVFFLISNRSINRVKLVQEIELVFSSLFSGEQNKCLDSRQIKTCLNKTHGLNRRVTIFLINIFAVQ